MKLKKQHKKGHWAFIPKSPALIILVLLFLIVEIVFMSLMIALNILPGVITGILLIVFIALTILIIKLLSSRKEHTTQRKVGTIISIVMIVILAIGTFYMFSTYSLFSKISSGDGQYEVYDVVALKDGSYKKVKDIDGQAVFVSNNLSETYEKAKTELSKEVDVTYKEAASQTELKNALVDGDGKEKDQIIFLSDSTYEMLCEYADEFKDKTKVIYTVSVKIESGDSAKRVGITDTPFNVYITGIDTYGGINKVSRSDVNMIMTVNPRTKEILLTSIPRDMYVTLHSYGALDKLTHSGIYGVNETVQTVEDWLELDINYYIRVNFTSLQDIVDVLGGVDVESEYAFSSSVSDYSYVKGVNHLDGEAALFFARERKSFEEGDGERIQNQQRVLKAIIEKITGSSVILTKYTSILNAVDDEIQTNMSQSDISALVKMQLKDLGEWDIQSISIKGKGTMAPTYSMGSRNLYVAIPDDESVKAAQDAIYEVMHAVAE